MITHAELLEVLHYDPRTGVFVWKVTNSNRAPAGSRAGSLGTSGYRAIGVHGRYYREHRLAWLYMTGAWPSDTIDHITGDPCDNRWENLREATLVENSRNRRISANNRAGAKGVSKCSNSASWVVAVFKDGKQHKVHVKTFEEACARVIELRTELHGDFARHT